MSDDADPSPRFRLAVQPRVLVLAGLGLAAFVAWLVMRTPEREGLGYHALGEGDGAPTVVLLHGYGAPGDDLVRLGEVVERGVPGVRVVCVEGAYATGLGGRAWYRFEDERHGAVDGVLRFVDSLAEDGTPRARMIVAGFSQGAAVAGDVGARRPDLAGVAILSGDHSTPTPPRGRLFVSHGREDPILSFGAAERHVDAYRATADVTFVPFDGGHRVAGPAEAAFVAWIAETLGAAPAGS